MTREEAVEKVWKYVTKGKIKEAKEIAYKYDIFMQFNEDSIAIEDDVFYLKGAEE